MLETLKIIYCHYDVNAELLFEFDTGDNRGHSKNCFWTRKGSQITTMVDGVVITLFEKCLRLSQYATDRKETSHTHS